MTNCVVGGLIFGAAGIVMATHGIGVGDWQLWAILALMALAELLGTRL